MRFSWLVFAFGFACVNDAPQLSYSIVHIQFDSQECQDEREACFLANIHYPLFAGLDSTKLIKAKRFVGNHILDALGMGDVESVGSPDIRKALDLVDQNLKDVKSSLNYGTGWIADVQTFPVYEDDTLLVFGLETMTYFGGAHPNTNRRYYNFNKITGEPYSYKWLANLPEINQRAESLFREIYNLKPSDSFHSKGFLFPKDVFQLPANFGIKKDSLILFYNRYEAAPYAFGPIELAMALK